MEYEVKQNPAPDEWAVLIWKRVQGKKELDGCAIFKGSNCHQRAIEYRDLMAGIEAGICAIVLTPKGEPCKSSAQAK
jgi:hypothetical protein